MIFGMTTFTFVHVAISLVGILSGLVVVFGLLATKRLDGWTALFLVTTVLTSVTGFFFPFEGFKPSYVVGAISLVVLAIAILARYRRQLAGGWRRTYVISAVIALYLNVFVLVVQLFEKVPASKRWRRRSPSRRLWPHRSWLWRSSSCLAIRLRRGSANKQSRFGTNGHPVRLDSPPFPGST